MQTVICPPERSFLFNTLGFYCVQLSVLVFLFFLTIFIWQCDVYRSVYFSEKGWKCQCRWLKIEPRRWRFLVLWPMMVFHIDGLSACNSSIHITEFLVCFCFKKEKKRSYCLVKCKILCINIVSVTCAAHAVWNIEKMKLTASYTVHRSSLRMRTQLV